MSDQINEFDQIFRDKLNGQTATPPPAVWDNIQAHRTFGHVVANKISNNWGIFGTLLMLILAGGSSIILFGEEENNRAHYEARLFQEMNTNKVQENNNEDALEEDKPNHNKATKALYPLMVASNSHDAKVENSEQKSNNIVARAAIPSPEELASLHQAAFVRPTLENKRLSDYIETLDGWEQAKPIGFVRYFNMQEIEKQSFFKNELTGSPKNAEIDYDYVSPRVERKTFKERSSILLTLTPHSVHKSMVAKYNLSSSFLEDRKKAEHTRFAYTFGAQLHYELQNHKFLESGVNITQIYEEMSYEGEKRFSNQYSFIEIPFLMGYEDRSAKWGWNLKAGFGVQVYNSYKGYILKRMDDFGGEEEEVQYRSNGLVRNIIENKHTLSNNQAKNEVVDLENEEENPFKTTGVVNLHVATGLVYYHSIRTSFLITPSYKRSINSITKESALFNERLTYMGISFGARMKF